MSNPPFITHSAVALKTFLCHLNPLSAIDISRWWQQKGFGIQSRTDYDFLHDVIREKLPYYIYLDMQQKYPTASKKDMKLARLIFRLGNYIHPSAIQYYGMPTDLNRFALDSTMKPAAPHAVAVLVQGEPAQSVYASIPLASLIIITDIDNVNSQLWQTITEHKHSITFDDRNIGIAIIDRKRFAEHYTI